MSEAFITRRGGGGGSGGFELTVYGGTTRPAKANHNAIWLNTDKEITSHVLSATEPANPVEGMSWITIGDSGAIKVASPVGGDLITVYPISAKQYISGAWVDVTAKSYQYGEWVDWYNGELYYQGNEYEDITGGWSGFQGYSGYTNGKVIKNDTSIRLQYAGSMTSMCGGPVNKIDLTEASKILVNIVDHTTNINFVVSTVRGIGVYDNAVAKILINATGYHELDVSSISGEYYVALTVNYAQAGSQYVEFDEVRLVK